MRSRSLWRTRSVSSSGGLSMKRDMRVQLLPWPMAPVTRAIPYKQTKPICRLEDFDWSASITMDRRMRDAVFSLEFLDRHEHVLLVGPTGVGKSFLAQALGYSAVRAGHTVRFSHAGHFFRGMNQARVDNSV